MIKKIALGLVGIVALVVAFAATRPDEFRVERSVTIAAPPAKIFPLVNDLKAQTTWSPWEKKDPALKRTFSENTTGKGAVYSWDGNADVGAGSLTITDSVPDSKVVMALAFTRPMQDTSVAELSLTPKGPATEVTWSMHGPMNLVSKVMCLFMSMDKMVGGDFEKGLADLKALAEK